MGASRSDTWMPLYIGDYLSDTAHLTCEQSGAYLHLIMHYWRVGALPDNDVALAQITRLPLKAWKAHRIIIAPFFAVAEGQWRHKRIEAERQRAKEVKKRYADRAKKGAAKRWQNDALSNATSIDQGCNGHGNSQLQGSNEPIFSADAESLFEMEAPKSEELTVEHVFEFYQELAQELGLPVPRDITPERRQLIKARILQNPLEKFLTVFRHCRESPFLRGDRGRSPLTFDWLIQKKNFQKVYEGNYEQ